MVGHAADEKVIPPSGEQTELRGLRNLLVQIQSGENARQLVRAIDLADLVFEAGLLKGTPAGW